MTMKAIGVALVMSAMGGTATPAQQLDQPEYENPAKPWASVEQAERDRRCRDRIEQVRAEAGRPQLERGPADADKPLMMYAVDRKIDGCSVMVPVADPTDIRTSPAPGKPERIPAR